MKDRIHYPVAVINILEEQLAETHIQHRRAKIQLLTEFDSAETSYSIAEMEHMMLALDEVWTTNICKLENQIDFLKSIF